MSFLFFLAGMEIDFKAIRGRPLTTAALGWLLSLGIALVLGFLLEWTGVVQSGILVAGALTTTALGTLIPILRDAKEINTKFGRFAVAAGALGEFGPIVLISVLLTAGTAPEGSPGGRLLPLLLLIGFTGIILVAAYIAAHALPAFLVKLLETKLHTSAQLPIRVSVVLLAALVILTIHLGLDSVLGAIAAGIVVGLACKGHTGEIVRQKLEAIGFGLFVPIFFIMSGIKFELTALLNSPAALALLPLFLFLFIVARGLPVLLCHRDLPRRDLVSLGLLSATALPLVVAIAEIGVETQRLKPETAAALVGAGMVSVLVVPLVALSLHKASPPDTDDTASHSAIPPNKDTEAG
jgi:Kef-type K+ transport system membrane component KefB